jgi:hypothetical protein
MFEKRYRFSVVLPTHNHYKEDMTAHINGIKREIMSVTGGLSFFPQNGSWVDQTSELIYTEKSLVLYTFCTYKQLELLHTRVSAWARMLQQICLSVTVEEVHHAFVPGTRELAPENIAVHQEVRS